jgi:ABC-type transport system substrate-binding protein
VNSWQGTAGKLVRAAALVAATAAVAGAAHAAEPKVLRYAFEIAETSFDPQRISDVYSNIVNQAMFEPPLTYDYLANPAKLKPNVATAMPGISPDGTTYTLHIKPGIYFADDPAFNGRKRELVAADFVYAMKRVLDPKVRASQIAEIEPYVVGAEEAASRARKSGKFDYDAPIEGMKVVDKYTFQVKIKSAMYVFIYKFADCRIACAVAREVVERYGEDFGGHPVGTGPFRLAFWKRSAKMVLERNPNFREEHWDAQIPAGDPRAAEFEALRGRRLPMIDRVEISVIEETQPRWLSFLNEEMDLAFLVPEEYAYTAFPNNKLAKNLERRGIRMEQLPTLDVTYVFFNMEDPVFGGYTPEKVALRRAISLSYKIKDEIAILRKGQAIPADAPYAPGVAGYDPDFHTTANEYNPAKAKALLDMFGYVDRDGDGFREMPDGSPLTLHRYSQPSSRDQQFDELWKRGLDEIGIRVEMVKEKWPDTLTKARQGKVQFWGLGNVASEPDADSWLTLLYGPNTEQNLGRFRLRQYDELYEKARALGDTPERTKLYQEMTKLIVAYAPWRINSHRIRTDMWYPQLVGYRRHPILTYNTWKYVDIDPAKKPGAPTVSASR